MKLHLRKQIIKFAIGASIGSSVAIYLALYVATNAFFRSYPAPQSEQSESIGIVLTEIAPWGCLASTSLIFALSLAYRPRIPQEIIRAEVVKYLNGMPGDMPEIEAIVSEIISLNPDDF